MAGKESKLSKMIDELGIYIWLGSGVLFALIVIFLLSMVKRYKEKMKSKLRSFYKEFVWNGFIRSITVSYLQAWVFCVFLAKDWWSG